MSRTTSPETTTRPTDTLRDMAQPDWAAATRHAFTDALADGSLPRTRMARYLAQDYMFIGGFVRLLASAIAHAPTLAASVPAAQFLALITGPENTYFRRSFEALGVTETEWSGAPAPPTLAFQSLMSEAAASGHYEQMLAVLVVAEWSYLEWATPHAPADDDLPFYYSEWITLHSGPRFEAVVAYLCDQLDRAWQTLDTDARRAVEAKFCRAVELERAFFDTAWNGFGAT